MPPEPTFRELRRAKLAQRLPGTLADLTGPAHGVVELPLHIAWSGLCRFDLGHPKLRMGLYRIVLAEGQREDVVRLLDRDLLVAQWPVLRTLIGRDVRDAWESAFPELTAVAERCPA
ncbi:transcriptional regulator [Streptomyces sp. NRRL B-1568]|nr:transcriptional regulator [Streptomyces sp. NRRL B-1568]